MSGVGILSEAMAREAQGRFEAHLQQFLASNEERYAYGEWIESLYCDIAEYVARKAKRVRPILLLGSHGLFAGADAFLSHPALRAAAAVELLHTFILIHDDIIDRSERRRGMPTFHKRVESRLGTRACRERTGQNIAMVAGDVVFALATECLLGAGFEPARTQTALRHFLACAADTGCGEIQGILLGLRDIARVSADDIRQVYALKTTRYTIQCPLVLGAILGGASDDAIEAIRDFAEPIGLAFQMLNDIEEFRHLDADDPMFPNDLLDGRKTLLVRAAFDRLGECDRSFLQLCIDSPSLGEPSIHKVAELIAKSGATAALAEDARLLFARAAEALDTPALAPDHRDGLLALRDHVTRQIGA